MAQNVQLRSNGTVSKFKATDTLHYTEYKLEDKSAATLKRQDPTTLILRHSFGKTSKQSPRVSEEVFYTTRYYAYSDGTLQAPTSQIFFKPVDLGKFEKEVKGIGNVERHPFLDGYYFLSITDKKWLTGEKIFSLCNSLFDSQLASVIEPVFVKQIIVENPLRPLQWNIRNNANVPGGVIGADMNVENAWNMGATGAGIRVAVIDDGVDLTHPDLVNNLLPGFDATGNNSAGAPAANNGHGTNCAGIIAATDNTDGVIGVAFNAGIIPIRMAIVVNNSFVNLTETMQATCFNEAVNRGADIISCSWGGGSVSAQVNAAIQNAVNNGRGGIGCVVLFAAGNNNNAISAISSNQNVIAVGASSTCDTRKRSSNNPALVNPGVTPDPEDVSCDGEGWWGSSFGTGLDVIAPGVWISTTDNVGANGFVAGNFNDRFNGTSAACPNTAAVVALILSVNPNLTGTQTRNILEQTCFKIPNGNFQTNIAGQPNGTWSNQAGYGRVDAGAAVCRAIETSLTLVGPNIVCNTEQYFTFGQNILWSSGNQNGLVIHPTTGVATRQNNFNGQVTITATIGGACGNINITKVVTVGTPMPTGIIGPDYDLCMARGGLNVVGTYSVDNPLLGIAYQWQVVTSTGQTSPAGSGISINLNGARYPLGCHTVRVRSISCSTFSPWYESTFCVIDCASRSFSIQALFPNPASDEVIVVFGSDSLESQVYSLKLVNTYQEVVYEKKTEKTQVTIPVSKIPEGIYYLNITDKDGTVQRRLLIKR